MNKFCKLLFVLRMTFPYGLTFERLRRFLGWNNKHLNMFLKYGMKLGFITAEKMALRRGTRNMYYLSKEGLNYLIRQTTLKDLKELSCYLDRLLEGEILCQKK